MPSIQSVKTRPARLTDLSKEDALELYVLNNSANARHKSPGVVIVNVPLSGNDTRIIRVPNTWVPVNIGLQLPKNKILESADFLQALNDRTLLGVLVKDAEAIFDEDPEAKEEWHRVAQNLMGGGSIEEQMGMVSGESEDAIDPDLNSAMVEAVNRDDIDEGELYSIIRNQAESGLLKTKDFKYIIDTSKHEKVKSFAVNRMQTAKS
jgi:hypothetical protein